jgi:hypothetical protein
MKLSRENIELTSTGSLVPTEQSYMTLTNFSRFQLSNDPFHEVNKISELMNKSNSDNWTFLDEMECGKYFAESLLQVSIIISDLDNETNRNSNDFQAYLLIFYNVLDKCNKLLLISSKFNNDFSKNKGLVSIFSFLKNKNLMNKLKKDENIEIFKIFVENLSIISRYAEKDKQLWLHFNVFDLLLELIDIDIKPNFNTLLKINVPRKATYIACLSTLANIGTDKQLEKLLEKENKPIYFFIFDCLINELEEFANNLENEVHYEFLTKDIQFNDDGNSIVRPIKCLNNQPISSLLLALYRLASNKKASNLFNENTKPIYVIIKHGQELEKKFALRLLIQICLNANISSNILNDRNLYSEVIKLSKRDSTMFDIKSLKTTVQRAMYVYQLLNENFQNSRQGSITYIESIINFQQIYKNKDSKPHVLISSIERHKSKPAITNEIIKQLETHGYRTYLNWNCDIRSIGISIENSLCMICCISEGYSLDEFCRFEALHTMKKNKPIIPIILKDRISLDQEKEWLLEMIIPNQPYIWFDNGINEEGFDRLFDKISTHDTQGNEDDFDENELKQVISNLGIKKRKCFKIVINKEKYVWSKSQ